ncbi:MAG: Gfo/Idh/MocA family oxidoreductase [candidate division FCPU426 bacterium]
MTGLRGRPVREIGIGVIGVGGIAVQHLEAYRNKGFKVVAGYDVSDAAFAMIREKFGIKDLFTDLKAFLALPGIDVLDIAIPHYYDLRKPLFEAVLAAGKPLFCQKPMAETLDQAITLVSMAEKAGVPFMMHQSALFVPGLIEAGKLLKDPKRFGEAFYFQIENRGDLWFTEHPHWGKRDRWIANGMGIHHLALAQHWFGTPVKVWSMMVKDPTRPYIKGENLAVFCLEYASGLRGMIINNWSYRGALTRSHPREEIIIEGSQGVLSGDISRLTLKTFEPPAEFSPTIQGDWFPDAFGNAMEHFLGSLSAGTPFLSTGRDDLWVMAAAEAAYLSAKDSIPVSPEALLRKAGALS